MRSKPSVLGLFMDKCGELKLIKGELRGACNIGTPRLKVRGLRCRA